MLDVFGNFMALTANNHWRSPNQVSSRDPRYLQARMNYNSVYGITSAPLPLAAFPPAAFQYETPDSVFGAQHCGFPVSTPLTEICPQSEGLLQDQAGFTTQTQNQYSPLFTAPSTPQEVEHGWQGLQAIMGSASPPPDDLSAMEGEPRLEDRGDDVAYAKLIYQCLMDTPGHQLSLREIYAWIQQRVPRAQDPSSIGWKNSIRHNLSMNQAFTQGEKNSGDKRVSLWRLTEDAVKNGVQSTTRYRRDPKRRAQRSGTPAPQRQRSGAKGGEATRRAASRLKAQSRARRSIGSPHTQPHRRHRQLHDPYPLSSWPSRAAAPPAPSQSQSPTPNNAIAVPAMPYFLSITTPSAPASLTATSPAPDAFIPDSATHMQLNFDAWKAAGHAGVIHHAPIDYPYERLIIPAPDSTMASPYTDTTDESYLNDGSFEFKF
ncbi:hypothetical protein LTR66_007497 [Elasticomyces elasticus]|nr:hypothetical protein LTR66_007497 [Elasticomyces elasticus]